MTRLDELLGSEALQALYRDTSEAHGLPGRAYEREFYRLEQQDCFRVCGARRDSRATSPIRAMWCR